MSVHPPLDDDPQMAVWLATRRFQAEHFADDLLQRRKMGTSIAVVVLTKDCAPTIDGVLRQTVEPFTQLGLVDELVVVDADSADGTAAIAEAARARVIRENDVLPGFGAVKGRGDAMWRALHVTTSEVVCFLDGATSDPAPAHLRGLIGPLLMQPSVDLVKGAFRSPHQHADDPVPSGDRVTELMARPLLNFHEPRLAGFSQPLTGEFAARRELLQEIPFPVGDGVEIAILIDAVRLRGLDAVAECDLGMRLKRHQPLRELGPIAFSVLAAVERRLPSRELRYIEGRLMQPWADGARVSVNVDERPALQSLARPAPTS